MKLLAPHFNLIFGRVTLASVLLIGLVSCTSSPLAKSANSPELTLIPPVPSPQLLPDALRSAKITARGFGMIRVGMTVQAAVQAAGVPLVTLGGDVPQANQSCNYVRLQNEPEGFEFMLNHDRIVRIDVRTKITRQVNGRSVESDLSPEVSTITTQEGAAIGSTEAEIQALYPGQVKVAKHKYIPDGHYLTVTSIDPADANYQLVFETDGDRVIYIRAGQKPEVDLTERCG
jgi:hypothetical protein